MILPTKHIYSKFLISRKICNLIFVKTLQPKKNVHLFMTHRTISVNQGKK